MLDYLEQNIELLHRQGLLVTQTYEDTVRPIQQQSSPELNTALRTLETDISRLQLCVAAFKPQEAPPSPSQLPLEFADPITVEPPARLKAA